MTPLNEVRRRGPNSPDILWTDGLVVTLSALGPSQNAACFSLHSSGGDIMSKRKRKQKQGKSVEGRLRILFPHIDGFRSWLQRNGYQPTTIVEVTRLLACWADWLQSSGFTLDNIVAGFNASAAVPELLTPVDAETSEYGAAVRVPSEHSSWQNGTIRVRQREY